MKAANQEVSSTSDPSRIRVLIADGQLIVLEGLAAIIGRQPDMTVIARAADGEEAVELWSRHRPDVTLLDLRCQSSTGSV